ncbi:MAG: hypothetical protein V4738_00065 [Pseudomonadota bacterium]
MSTSLLLLTATYSLLAFLLLCLCFWTRWPVALKVLLICVVTVFYFLAYEYVHGVLGWPAEEAPPKRFVLLAVVVDEPSKERGTKGSIFVWLNGIEDNRPVAEPRSYRLPYEKDLHSLFSEAMKKNRQGISQMGTTEPKSGPKGFSWLRPPGNDKLTIKISDLPRPQLPEK